MKKWNIVGRGSYIKTEEGRLEYIHSTLDGNSKYILIV